VSVSGFYSLAFLVLIASMKLKLTAEGVYRKEYSRQQKSM